MQESLRMSPQRQEVCSTKKLCMLVLIMVNLNVDAVSPPWTQMLVTSLNWSLPFLQDLNYPIKTWIMLLSKSVHKCSMNTSLQLLHNLLLARQECEYTHRKWLTAKWWWCAGTSTEMPLAPYAGISSGADQQGELWTAEPCWAGTPALCFWKAGLKEDLTGSSVLPRWKDTLR